MNIKEIEVGDTLVIDATNADTNLPETFQFEVTEKGNFPSEIDEGVKFPGIKVRLLKYGCEIVLPYIFLNCVRRV
jgi:hypothetical protein